MENEIHYSIVLGLLITFHALKRRKALSLPDNSCASFSTRAALKEEQFLEA